jgi:hypothetical protein
MRFMFTTKWSPYVCPACTNPSRPDIFHFLFLSLGLGLLVTPLGIAITIGLSSLAMGIVVVVLIYLVLILLLIRFWGRLSPTTLHKSPAAKRGSAFYDPLSERIQYPDEPVRKPWWKAW